MAAFDTGASLVLRQCCGHLVVSHCSWMAGTLSGLMFSVIKDYDVGTVHGIVWHSMCSGLGQRNCDSGSNSWHLFVCSTASVCHFHILCFQQSQLFLCQRWRGMCLSSHSVMYSSWFKCYTHMLPCIAHKSRFSNSLACI